MILFRTNKYLLIGAIVLIIIVGILVNDKEKEGAKKKIENVSIPPPPKGDENRVRGYNFETGGWIYYTEEELKTIKETKSNNSHKQKNE